MQSILILYNSDNWNAVQPSHSDAQKFGYDIWGYICMRKKVLLTRASLHWFNNTTNAFDKHWEFQEGKWIKKENDKFKPDVIYDKSRNYDSATIEYLPDIFNKKIRISSCVPIVNNPDMTDLLDNKLNQVVLFANYMPRSILVNKGVSFEAKKDAPVVLKKFFGSGGKQVRIVNEGKIVAETRMIKQDFIQARRGGVLRDVRLVFIGDGVQYGLSRIAKEDSFYTNFHQGARIEFLDLTQYTKLIKKAKEITKPLKIFSKRVFALDFLIDAKTKQEYLMEINTKPGLDVFDEHSKPILESYVEKLTDYLLN
jgi:glutathione synthase/RimK-type ligase-like ATP-grasp enzyme